MLFIMKELLKQFLRPLKQSLRSFKDFLRPTPSRKKVLTGEFGVNLSGYFESEKGVGMAVRSDALILEQTGIPFVLNNFPDSGSQNRIRVDRPFTPGNPHQVNLIHVGADQFFHFIRTQGSAYVRNRYNIGYIEWELSEFLDEWLPSLTYLDEIWTASGISLDSISQKLRVPVIKMPHAVVPPRVEDTRRPRLLDGLEGRYLFLFVFDFQSLFARKNPLGLIEAFRLAFRPEEPVTLVLKASHAESCPEEFALLQEAAAGASIRIVNEVLEFPELQGLFFAADCYVSLHRAEGFGLTLAEAMAIGKPVVATGYSGNLDFMNVNNSYLVKYRLVEIDRDHGPYRKGMTWAEPDTAHAALELRRVFDHPDQAREVGRRAALDIQTHLSPDAIARNFRKRLHAIAGFSRD